MSDSEVSTRVHEFTNFAVDTTPRRKMSNIFGHVIEADCLSNYDGYDLICRLSNPLAFASLGAAQWAVSTRKRAMANDEQDKLVSPDGLGSDAFGEFLKGSHIEEIGMVAPERNGPHTIQLYLTAYLLAKAKGRLVYGPEWKPGPTDGGMQPYALKNAWEFRLSLAPSDEVQGRLRNELNELLMAEEEAMGLPARKIEEEAAERRKARNAQRQDTLKDDWPEIEKEVFSHSAIRGMADLDEAWNKLPLATQFKCWNAVVNGTIQATARARVRAVELTDKEIGDKAETYHKEVAAFSADLITEMASEFAKFRDELVSLQDNGYLRGDQIPDFIVGMAEKKPNLAALKALEAAHRTS